MVVEISRRDEAAVITLNRPEALNALSFSILDELGAAFDEITASDARVLLITGTGDKAFCAGADIKELRDRDLLAQKRGAEKGQAVFSKLASLPMPSVAVINGYAFGGGLELTMACTFRLATANARMGLPEIKLGLIPGYGGTQRLPRLVGEARAMEMIMTGRAVKPDEAERIGLVNRVIEGDAIEQALAFSREFTCYSLPALGFARAAVTRALDMSLEEGLRTEADLSTLAFQMKDASEGMAAFQEKRKPEFRDE
ncbi:MAG: enoyl-CoA hydratase-related protein [Burkholderiales bacterium]|jgi:enoyl-CoA hydratase